MRSDKEKAFELRKSGKSFALIRKELGVPLGTLSGWFRDVTWSKELEHRLRKEGREAAGTRVRELNRVRGDRLQKAYEAAAVEAKEEFRSLRYDPLFVAGMALYWQQGSKGVRGQVRFSSSDPQLITFFMAFLERCCGMPKVKVKAAVFAHPGLDGPSAARFWALGTGIPFSQFNKPMTVPGKHDARQLTYGTCTLTVSNTYLKEKMLEWLRLLPKELIDTR